MRPIEHPSVLETAKSLDKDYKQLRLEIAPVDNLGRIVEDKLLELIGDQTTLVSLMLANHETGAIQPIGKLSSRIKARFPRCLIHTDGTQAVGKIPI